MAGITGNTGSNDEFVLPFSRPVTELDEGFVNGIPDSWTNLAVSGSAKWSTYAYPAAAPTTFCAQFRLTNASSTPIDAWLITPGLDIMNARGKNFSFSSEVNNVGNNVIEVYILNSNDPESATVKQKLNPILPNKPTSGTYSAWTSSGDIDLSQWADGVYYIGFRFNAPAGSNYTTWCINNVKFGQAPKLATSSDFETILQGQEMDYTTTLGNYTSAAGWVANNCTILKGGDSDSNPVFAFIGKSLDGTTFAKAPTMCGGTTTVGTIVSPTLKGGMKKLRFNYGCAYSGKVLSFRVDVKQNGNVVKTWTITNNNVTQKNAYAFEESCSVNGEFTIEFTNLCPSNATGNTRDRVSIWNVNWDSAE